MSRSDVAFLLVVLGLFFLFMGEPDVWDGLHAAALRFFDPVCL
jgi:hypothetical protein